MRNIALAVGLAALACALGAAPSFAEGADEKSTNLSESEKMQKIEEMFKSPYSEEMYYRTDRLLITATGSMLPIHKAPAVATIITAEDIERMGATQLSEVLETVPGLHVALNTLARMDPVYSIRGIHTPTNPQVLFMVNGLPIMQAFHGSRPPTFRMPVANIARVEVVRGPGSAVHGADAFAGTINVITKDGRDMDGTAMGGRVGSFDATDAWLQHGAARNGWDMSFSLGYNKSKGDKDRRTDQDLQTIFDGLFSTNVSRAPGTLDTKYEVVDAHMSLAKENWTVRAWGWLNNNAGLGDGATHVSASKSSEDMKQLLTDLTYHSSELISNLDLTLRGSYIYLRDDVEYELFPPESTLPVGDDGNLFTSRSDEKTSMVNFTDGVFGNPGATDKYTSVDLTLFHTGFNRHRIRLGTGYRDIEEESRESKNFGPGVIDGANLSTDVVTPVDGSLTDVADTPNVYISDHSRSQWYLSLQDEWSMAKNWEITAGARYDRYSDFGGTINPRAALLWEPRFDLTTKLLYGKAFRSPSFAELYAANNPSTIGNEDLNPETIDTYEFVADYQPFSSLRTILNLFLYDIEDLIAFVPGGGGASTAQNSKDQRGYGFEFEVDWKASENFGVNANFAYQRSWDKSTGEPIPDAPRAQLFLNPHWRFLPNWSLDGRMNWVGLRERTKNDTRSPIDNYTIVDATLRRKSIWKRYDFALAVRNLFNEDAREPSSFDPALEVAPIPKDYPMEGRSFFGEIQLKF